MDGRLCKNGFVGLHGFKIFIPTTMYRLNEAIAERDATHASLVSADVLAGVQADLDAARSENERILSIHRQLLVRYSAVKFMIDGSFKKIDAAKVIQSGILLNLCCYEPYTILTVDLVIYVLFMVTFVQKNHTLAEQKLNQKSWKF